MSEILKRAVKLSLAGVQVPPEAIAKQIEIERAPETVPPPVQVTKGTSVGKSQVFFPTRKRLPSLGRDPFSKLKVVPVKRGHRFYPDAKKFTVRDGAMYVREEDWPKLEAAIKANRAAKAGAS